MCRKPCIHQGFRLFTRDVDWDIDWDFWDRSSNADSNRRKMGKSQRRVDDGGFESGGVSYGLIPLILKRIRHLDCTDDLGLIFIIKVHLSTLPYYLPAFSRRCTPHLFWRQCVARWRWKFLGWSHKYLQVAVSAASIGDEIRVAEGTYKPVLGRGKIQGEVTASFNLVCGVEMYGGFLGTDLTTYI